VNDSCKSKNVSKTCILGIIFLGSEVDFDENVHQNGATDALDYDTCNERSYKLNIILD